MGSIRRCPLGLAILMQTSPTESLMQTDGIARAIISKGGHVSASGRTAAPASPPPDSSPDCSSFDKSQDCLQNNCGWNGKYPNFCASCASFTGSSTCPPRHGGCAWIDNKCRVINTLMFGGAVHASQSYMRRRPEELYSARCSSSDLCSPCLDLADCWHGTKEDLLTVNLVAFSTGSRRATVWANCVKDESPWSTGVNEMSNGILEVKLNGELKTKWTALYMDDTRQTGKPPFNSVVGHGDNIMEFTFKALESLKDAMVTIYTSVSDVEAWVDTCMARKTCLQKLGDGTSESFELRNDNKRQLKCLQSASPAGICKEWMGCMGDSMKKTLEAILRVVLRKPLAGAQRRRRRKTRRSASLVDQASGCINPSNFDPEAAECECFDDIQESCAGKGDEEDCLLKHVCSLDNVCDEWRDQQCTASLGSTITNVDSTGSLLIQRGQAEANGTALGNIEDTLKGESRSLLAARSFHQEKRRSTTNSSNTGDMDSALHGKCSV